MILDFYFILSFAFSRRCLVLMSYDCIYGTLLQARVRRFVVVLDE